MLNSCVLVLCLTLLVHVWGMEAFVVPTGSMAPTLAGHHRLAICPCCGLSVMVGRHPADKDGKREGTYYRGASCPNCGHSPLPLDKAPEAKGDHILVNKNVFLFRRPRRWEIVVFRLFGKIFVKRVIGLPGEWLLIDDGDVYINGMLARKSLEECRQVRVLVFDNNFQPRGIPPHPSPPMQGRGETGWRNRWQSHDGSLPFSPSNCELVSDFAIRVSDLHGDLTLDTRESPERIQWLSYQHFSLEADKAQAIRDEYAYNGGSARAEEAVHDFMLDCDVEVLEGNGELALEINDGRDALMVTLPAGAKGEARLLHCRTDLQSVPHAARALLPAERTGADCKSALPEAMTSSRHGLFPGKRYHLELAFVDRRLTAAVNATELFPPLNLPPAKGRPAVTCPVALGARGVRVVFRNVRLYRDIHYTQAGRHGVDGQVVRLGAEQYFVLGDNSPNSEDSRFWPNHGAVPADRLLGKPFLIHLPMRVVSGTWFGHAWQYQLPDWSRLRWLH
jgi:signal peptidase I